MSTVSIRGLVLTGLTTLVFALSFPSVISAAQQTGSQSATDKQRAIKLVNDSKLQEALPILERLAKDNPNDPQVEFYLGYVKLWSAKLSTDPAERKRTRAEAYACFKKASDLGVNTPLVKSMLKDLPPDGGDDPVYSTNKAANEKMIEAEADFARGNLEKALASYQQALEIEPTLYNAALFAGDACFKSGDQDRAIQFYAKAIAIDPDRETAYRYTGDALMKQGKTTEARDKYIEAYITEPYARLSAEGLITWAKKTGAGLSHPQIDIPTKVTFDDKDHTNITLDANSLNSKKDDGSSAWMMYGITRALWHNEKFAKTFPNEKTYRHSLAEEADALGMVVESVAVQVKDKTAKNLSPSLAELVKLKAAGLLEAYILLGKADEGIARDYPAYLKANRDKLRRYVVEFVIHDAK